MATTATRLESERYYNLNELHEMRAFPWYRSINKYRQLVHADRGARNVLRSHILGHGRGREYRIKGKHVAAFVEACEERGYLEDLES